MGPAEVPGRGGLSPCGPGPTPLKSPTDSFIQALSGGSEACPARSKASRPGTSWPRRECSNGALKPVLSMLTRARTFGAVPRDQAHGWRQVGTRPGPTRFQHALRWRRTPSRSGHRARRRCENEPAAPGLVRPASAIPATNSSRSSTPRNDPARLVAVLLRLQQSAHPFRRAMADAPWIRTDVPVSAAKRSTATAPCRRLERTR